MPLAFTHAQTYELTYLDGPYIGDEHPDGHRAFAMKSHPDAVRCHCPPIPPPPPQHVARRTQAPLAPFAGEPRDTVARRRGSTPRPSVLL